MFCTEIFWFFSADEKRKNEVFYQSALKLAKSKIRLVKTVQSNLGHVTAAFTLDVYGHVSERMKEDSAARMEKYMRNMA